MRHKTLTALALVGLALGACDEKKKAKPADKPTASSQPTSHASGPRQLFGTVAEKVDAGRYTYVRLQTAEGDVWAAVPKATLTLGQPATVTRAMPMTNFKSKTLDRTFPLVYFGQLGGAKAPSGASKGPQKLKTAHARVGAKQIKLDKPLTRAEGGKTVAEIFAARARLSGKQVKVRGKVVKVNNGIMGKNWVHLQDGTGTAKEANHDLTVTTQDKVTPGQVVVAEGMLGVDRKLGMGYDYPVLLEKATVKP